MCPSKLFLKVALYMESPFKRIQEWYGYCFASCKNSIPRMTYKLSKGSAVKLVLPLQSSIYMPTPFANLEIGSTSKLSAFMWLGLFTNFSLNRFVS